MGVEQIREHQFQYPYIELNHLETPYFLIKFISYVLKT